MRLLATKKIKKESKKEDEEVLQDISVESPDAPQRAIVSHTESLIIKPMISPLEAKEAWKAYTDLCNAILVPEDFSKIVTFAGAGKGSITKYFKNKSAWRKLATAFNLSIAIEKEERIEVPVMKYTIDKAGNTEFAPGFVINITAKVTAPNGRSMVGAGSCSSNERKFVHQDHDVRAMAETRAKSRAISDMIGAGETTAEEVMQMEESRKSKCIRDHDALQQKVVATPGKNKDRPYKKCPSCTFFEWQDTLNTPTDKKE